MHLRQILKSAVRSKLIAWSPADAIEPPRRPKVEAKALDQAAARALMAAAQRSPYRAFLMVAMSTGARFGELTALTWADVNGSIVDINKSHSEFYDPDAPAGQRTKLVVGPPKTRASRRKILLGDPCVAALRELRSSSGTIPHPTLLIFTDEKGLPLRTSSFRRKVWKPLLRRAGLPATTMFKNATRHTAASLALEEGVSPKIMQERLGHSSIATLLEVYSHTSPQLHEKAVGSLDSAMFGDTFEATFDDTSDDNQRNS